jgi:hypothetical protein
LDDALGSTEGPARHALPRILSAQNADVKQKKNR